MGHYRRRSCLGITDTQIPLRGSVDSMLKGGRTRVQWANGTIDERASGDQNISLGPPYGLRGH